MTRLGYQIPNFTYPSGTNIFQSVVKQAQAAEASSGAVVRLRREGSRARAGGAHAGKGPPQFHPPSPNKMNLVQ